MSGPPSAEHVPDTGVEPSPTQRIGIVERLVRDDLDRKRFLKMAGSAGAASFGAFVLAACGSSKSSSTARRPPHATTTSTSARGTWRSSTTRSRSSTWRRVLRQGDRAGLFTGKVGNLIKDFGAQEKTHVEALKGHGWKSSAEPRPQTERKIPDRKRQPGRRAGLHRRESRRGGVPRPGPNIQTRKCSRQRWRSTPSRLAMRRRRHAGQEVDHPDGAFASRLKCPRCWRLSSRSWPERSDVLKGTKECLTMRFKPGVGGMRGARA